MSFCNVFYVLCGIISYGLIFAYIEAEFKIKTKESYCLYSIMCFYFAILGPITLTAIWIYAMINSKPCYHGFKYK